MTEFTTADGIVLVENPNHITVRSSAGLVYLGNERAGRAVKAYLDHRLATARDEEDKRLGRWRWPENPDYIVYPEGGGVRVLRETAGTNWYPLYRPINPVSAEAAIQYRIAAAYFDAHPEPKPWHDAKPGEVWALSASPNPAAAAIAARVAVINETLTFENCANIGDRFEVTDARIRKGERIWPRTGPAAPNMTLHNHVNAKDAP